MAWIESHQTLGRHVKLAEFRRALGVGKAQAVGHLHFLWWWALESCPDGDMSQLAPDVIAEAAEWDGDPDVFVSALKLSRFMDPDGKLHNWSKYVVRLMESREWKKERDRRYQQARRRRLVDDVETTSTRCRDDIDATSQRVANESASNRQATVPYRTVPYQIHSTSLSHSCTPVASDPVTERETEDAVDRPPAPSNASLDAFERFWAAYPAKRARGDAEHAWVEVGAVNHTEAILSALQEQRHCDDWQRDRGRWIPMPARWLRDRRWEDQPADTRPNHEGGF